MGMVHHEIMRLAELRHDLITGAQLHMLGFDARRVRRWIAAKRLFPLFPGVYSTSAGPHSFERRAAGACLAVPGGVLSHSTAAFLHGIRRVPRELLDLTIPPHRVGRLAEVHFHRSTDLSDYDVLEWIDGSRMTTPARCLFELASVLDGRALRSAIEDAKAKQLVTDAELAEVKARLCRRGRPGTKLFREVVGDTDGVAPVDSHDELVLKRALEEVGLAPVARHPYVLPNGRQIRMDVALLHSRVDVEVDNSAHHTTALRVRSDKARDVQLVLAGWQPLRFDEDDIGRRLRSVVGYVSAVHRMRLAA